MELRDAASQESSPGNGHGKPAGPSPYLARFKVPAPRHRESPLLLKGNVPVSWEPGKPGWLASWVSLGSDLAQGRNGEVWGDPGSENPHIWAGRMAGAGPQT